MDNKSWMNLLKKLNIKMKLLNGNRSIEFRYHISFNKHGAQISATL